MNAITGIGVYRKEDYPEILRLSEDRDNMDQTWEEWEKSKSKAMTNFKNMGLKTMNITVSPIELVNYCRTKGLPINGQSRSQFISFKASLLNSN